MKSFFKFLLVIIIVAVVAVVGAFVYFQVAYDINLINTFRQVNSVIVPTDTQSVVNNAFTVDDMQSAQTKINNSIADFISYSQEDGYGINSGIPETTKMTGNINLTDKECGAILNLLLNNSSAKTNIQIEDITLNFELVQIAFSNLEEKSIDFNSIVKVDIRNLKNKFSKEWFSFLLNKLPNELYVSSTITITKLENPFSYTKTSKSLTINNLNNEDTAELLTVVNKFVEIGKPQDLTLLISGGFADALITGTEDNFGFAKTLTVLGATDFEFGMNENIINFIIKK